MFARVTTVRGQADRLDTGIRTFQEQIVPLIQRQPGFQGASLLVDRQRGTVLALSLWESQAAMAQSEQAVATQRTQTVQQLGGSTPTIERYGVAFTEGSRTGRYARVAIGYGTGTTSAAVLRYVREVMLPTLRVVPGCGGALQLMNWQAGTLRSLLFCDSADALHQASEMAQRMRPGAARAGIRGLDTAADYEVALQL